MHSERKKNSLKIQNYKKFMQNEMKNQEINNIKVLFLESKRKKLLITSLYPLKPSKSSS
jgi:DNA repair protein RadC